jgi:uncharacterized membrane protein
MQCPQCHNEVEPQSTFCAHCGASLAAAAPPEATAKPPAPPEVAAASVTPQPGYPPPAASSGLSANAAAALAYLTFIPALLFLILEPYNKIPLVRFHSFQSIGLTLVWIALRILFAFLLFTPFIHFLFFFLEGLVFLGLFIVWLIAILKASKGEWFKLPVIGDIALKQAQS